MTGYLTTHVLDTARGCPAERIRIALFAIQDKTREKLAEMETNGDGRTDSPILPKGAFRPGRYELVFFAGDYLDRHGLTRGGLKFLDEIPVRFSIHDGCAHYHVPLLLSPFGYSTYRGS